MKLSLDIHESRIASLLCCGMEGGIGYWARIEEYKTPANPIAYADWNQKGDDKRIYKHIDYPLCEDGAVILKDMESHTEGKLYTLDKKAILKGLSVMAEKYPKHFSNFISENDDATTGDVFIQCCVFGKIIYG